MTETEEKLKQAKIKRRNLKDDDDNPGKLYSYLQPSLITLYAESYLMRSEPN